MSYGRYSLNNINQICSGGGGTGAAYTVSGTEPVFVIQTGNDYNVSLYENPAHTINFAAFDKSLAVMTLDAHVDVRAPLFTGASANFSTLQFHSATGTTSNVYMSIAHSFTGANADFYNLRAHSATGDRSSFYHVEGHSFSGPYAHFGQLQGDSITGAQATIHTLTGYDIYATNLYTDTYNPVDITWQIATGALSYLDVAVVNSLQIQTGVQSNNGYALSNNPYSIVNDNTSTFSVKNSDTNKYPFVIVGDVINTFDLQPDADSTYEIGDFGSRYLTVYSDNFVGDNATLGGNLTFSSATGGNLECSGYIVGENLIATTTLAGPLVSCETGFFQNLYATSGTFGNSAAWGDWQIQNHDPQLHVRNINAVEPTQIFQEAFPNPYILSATTLPIRSTATLGSLSAPWSEVHTRKLLVDTNTIEFVGSATGAPAYIKSKYIDIEIPTPSGPPIVIAGNNIESDYISATGSFSLFSTSEFSSTLVQTTSDLYADTLQGFNRGISISAQPGAGTGPILSATGSNLGGKIALTAGSNAAQWSAICTVDFTKTWPNEPAISLTPGNQSAARLLGDSSVFVTSDLNSFTIWSGTTPLREGLEFKWHYTCSG